MTHQDGIGDRARNELLEEAVAFANAYGGALVLGIAESKAKPPVAARICPIPRCADLAERLKLVFRDCVEPQIPRVDIFAVPIADDAGVVIISTGRSRMAPHRVKPTRKCPIRRSDRCEEMTMREIQDLTLNLSRGMEQLERRLAMRSERFAEEFKRLELPDLASGIRVTAVPVGGDVNFERVYGNDDLYGYWHRLSLAIEGITTELRFPPWREAWRPLLRAARTSYFDDILTEEIPGIDFQIYREIHCDGLVEIGVVDCRAHLRVKHDVVGISCDWLMIVFANLLVWADCIRKEASLPTAEYAVDVELNVRGDDVPVRDYGDIRWRGQDTLWAPRALGSLNPGSVKYPGELIGEPRYALGEQDEIPDLIAMFERDLWNSIGVDVGQGQRSFVIEDWK